MAKAKKHNYASYPKEADLRVGCKVSWYYYWTEAEAKKASEAAKVNAAIQASLGYDFGYCCPGSVRKVPAGGDYAGLWEVCIP